MGTRGNIDKALLIACLASGCDRFRCGAYEHQTGIEFDIAGDDEAPEAIDDYALHEICGAKMGSIGYTDLLGDGIAHVMLDGTHPDSHVAIALTSAIFRDVYFPTALLEVGTTIRTEDMLPESSAYVLSNGSVLSGVFLAEGEIEILEVAPNDFWATDAYRMRFDVTYGEPGVSAYWYTSVGEDWIAMQ